ncbi:hypothetical protein PU630_14030 [Microbacterium horticulturae]|uniref:DUF3618 domain-containing protein n=1 Tax=Microbacterium horticulturae TaxID=3028316 RepID=A0ABY8BVZ7_9MICO|nr:hypothetical protein [Microbacterium sp. KACC 23027]WEG08344.1 hypothetical protein PU630_14030 [Microbacterium sp. KACC 23027]
MSSDSSLPRTVVDLDIDDPVLKARAELKSALAAIEEKANVPKRVARATERGTARARVFARKNPALAAIAVIGAAAAVGALVWGAVALYTRPGR